MPASPLATPELGIARRDQAPVEREKIKKKVPGNIRCGTWTGGAVGPMWGPGLGRAWPGLGRAQLGLAARGWPRLGRGSTKIKALGVLYYGACCVSGQVGNQGSPAPHGFLRGCGASQTLTGLDEGHGLRAIKPPAPGGENWDQRSRCSQRSPVARPVLPGAPWC